MKQYYIEKDALADNEETKCISLVLDLGREEVVYLGTFDNANEFHPIGRMCFDMDDIKEVLKIQQLIFHNGFDLVYTHTAI